MVKKSPTEIFSVDALDSVVRKIIREHGVIDLAEHDIPTYRVPKDYAVLDLKLDSASHAMKIRKIIEPVAQDSESQGFGSGLFTAVYEAILNAFQHGNKKDPSKRLLLGYKVTDEQADFVIVDSGGKIDAELASYVLLHRMRNTDTGKIPDFYKFTNMEPRGTNLGTGTKFMHIYARDVHYFKHEDGGLAVKLTFVKD